VEVEDEDSWDFGTIKQAPPAIAKPSLQMHNSPSQYSINNFTTAEKPPGQQLPRTVSRNQVNPQPPHSSPPNTRINEVTVSPKKIRFIFISIFTYMICI
jgi:hypothetical protein